MDGTGEKVLGTASKFKATKKMAAKANKVQKSASQFSYLQKSSSDDTGWAKVRLRAGPTDTG